MHAAPPMAALIAALLRGVWVRPYDPSRAHRSPVAGASPPPQPPLRRAAARTAAGHGTPVGSSVNRSRPH